MPDTASPVIEASPHRGAQVAHRRAVIGLISAATVAAVLTLLAASTSPALDGFDTAIMDFTRGWADPLGWPVDVAHVVGLVTAPFWSALAAIVLVVILLLTRHRAAAGLLAMSGIAGVLVSETMKGLMGRSRPLGAEAFEPDLYKSFPSGHAMEGIYLYLATGLVLIHLSRSNGRRWLDVVGRVLVAIGPLIGLSRLILGVHWPSDVIAGWAFGSVVLLGTALILWWPVDRGWAPVEDPATRPTPPTLPEAGTTPAPPAR